MKILLIDQDSNVLEMLQTSLSRNGYTVLLAADGHSGLRLAQDLKPDLIVMDVALPSINGLELCHQLQQIPETANIPVFVTSYLNVGVLCQTENSTQNAKLPTFRAFMPKPINLHQFLRQVEVILKPNKITPPGGPNAVLTMANDTLRNNVKALLKAKDYNLVASASPTRSIEAMRTFPPSVLVIDDTQLNEDSWESLRSIRERNPTFTLVMVLSQDEEPEDKNLIEVDALITNQMPAWRIVHLIEKAMAHRSAETRINRLSSDVLTLNQTLLDQQQTLAAQNDELEFINRKLRHMSELKEMLTGMLVHDLKTPISAMLGSMQFLMMDPGTAISESSLRILNSGIAAGKQLQRLTETMLFEQKLENHQLVFDHEPCNLQHTLDESLEMLLPLMHHHQVTLKLDLPHDLAPLNADPTILRRVLENLLDNALKYSPPGEYITVQAREREGMIEIRIADRGDGIPEAHRPLIFDRFKQIEHDDNQKMRFGVGLGLTFCKLAVETMNGEIWVGDSLEGVGATFYFTIPADQS